MLKIHSFLHRMKKYLCKFFPQSIGKYKNHMAIVSYIMATVLILISPDYIYGSGEGKTLAKAEITNFNLSNTLSTVEEETDNKAVIRVNDNNPSNKFILNGFTNDGKPIGAQEYLKQEIALDNIFHVTSQTAEMSLDVDETAEHREGRIVKRESSKEQISSKAVIYMDVANEEKSKAEDVIVEEKEKADESPEKEEKAKKTKTDERANSKKDRADAKEEVDSGSTKDEKKKEYAIELSNEDIEILERIVEAEATGEDLKGKILVANVILNRVKDKNFPDTIEEVVFQKDGNTYQFSPIKDKRYWSVKVTKETITAVDRVMQGEDYSEGALYFSARTRADKNSMKWFDSSLDYLFQYGGHEFFKNK